MQKSSSFLHPSTFKRSADRNVHTHTHTQIKTITQTITPEEYDAAVARDHLCSIHTATGDNRSGNRLLAEADADRYCSISAMAASPVGRAVLDCLSVAAESFAAELPD